jgi:hypothetical protein
MIEAPGQKGLPVTNTLAHWSHLLVTEKKSVVNTAASDIQRSRRHRLCRHLQFRRSVGVERKRRKRVEDDGSKQQRRSVAEPRPG